MYAIKLGSKFFSDVAEFSGELEANGFDLFSCEFVMPTSHRYRTITFASRAQAEEVVEDLSEGGGLNDLMGEAFSGLEVVEV